jgi:hypothetical protein
MSITLAKKYVKSIGGMKYTHVCTHIYLCATIHILVFSPNSSIWCQRLVQLSAPSAPAFPSARLKDCWRFLMITWLSSWSLGWLSIDQPMEVRKFGCAPENGVCIPPWLAIMGKWTRNHQKTIRIPSDLGVSYVQTNPVAWLREANKSWRGEVDSSATAAFMSAEVKGKN